MYGTTDRLVDVDNIVACSIFNIHGTPPFRVNLGLKVVMVVTDRVV